MENLEQSDSHKIRQWLGIEMTEIGRKVRQKNENGEKMENGEKKENGEKMENGEKR